MSYCSSKIITDLPIYTYPRNLGSRGGFIVSPVLMGLPAWMRKLWRSARPLESFKNKPNLFRIEKRAFFSVYGVYLQCFTMCDKFSILWFAILFFPKLKITSTVSVMGFFLLLLVWFGFFFKIQEVIFRGAQLQSFNLKMWMVLGP